MRRKTKILAALLWLALLGASFAWAGSQGYGVLDLARALHAHIAGHSYAPMVYILIYALRPLIFFPAMWLTLLGGSVFGFWPALFYTVIGQNLSAQLAYGLGRLLVNGQTAGGTARGLLARWRALLDEQAFSTVLILRVVYSPYELVSYGCGLLRVPWMPYTLATLLGTMPSLLTFVSFGASLDFAELGQGVRQPSLLELLDARQLLISGGLLAFSLLVAWAVGRRHRQHVITGSA
ncbi:MAG TPA: VTT domain-containing protein [Nevskiales bacterium]|nr:VTT domain-containing protein [Nevskiales bacterium]